jgi:hypothetical protein
MPKHTDKELSATARNQTDKIICEFGLADTRKIINQMYEIIEAKHTDLEKKYGKPRL